VLSVEHHVCFTSVKSVVLYRWHDSRSDWRALACPRPRLHLFLPPPLSSGSYWRPERRTCSLYTEHMQMQIQRDATPHTHTQLCSNCVCARGSVLITSSQAISASSLLFWTTAQRKRSPPASLGASAWSSSSGSWETVRLLDSWIKRAVICCITLIVYGWSHIQWVRKVFRPLYFFHFLFHCIHLLKSKKFVTLARSEWQRIPKYRCEKLVASFPRRLMAALAQKAASTQY